MVQLYLLGALALVGSLVQAGLVIIPGGPEVNLASNATTNQTAPLTLVPLTQPNNTTPVPEIDPGFLVTINVTNATTTPRPPIIDPCFDPTHPECKPPKNQDHKFPVLISAAPDALDLNVAVAPVPSRLALIPVNGAAPNNGTLLPETRPLPPPPPPSADGIKIQKLPFPLPPANGSAVLSPLLGADTVPQTRPLPPPPPPTDGIKIQTLPFLPPAVQTDGITLQKLPAPVGGADTVPQTRPLPPPPSADNITKQTLPFLPPAVQTDGITIQKLPSPPALGPLLGADTPLLPGGPPAPPTLLVPLPPPPPPVPALPAGHKIEVLPFPPPPPPTAYEIQKLPFPPPPPPTSDGITIQKLPAPAAGPLLGADNIPVVPPPPPPRNVERKNGILLPPPPPPAATDDKKLVDPTLPLLPQEISVVPPRLQVIPLPPPPPPPQTLVPQPPQGAPVTQK